MNSFAKEVLNLRSIKLPVTELSDEKKERILYAITTLYKDIQNNPILKGGVTQCPICYNEVENLSVICDNGHMICTQCLDQVDMCPYCRGMIIGRELSYLIKIIIILILISGFSASIAILNTDYFQEIYFDTQQIFEEAIYRMLHRIRVVYLLLKILLKISIIITILIYIFCLHPMMAFN